MASNHENEATRRFHVAQSSSSAGIQKFTNKNCIMRWAPSRCKFNALKIGHSLHSWHCYLEQHVKVPHIVNRGLRKDRPMTTTQDKPGHETRLVHFSCHNPVKIFSESKSAIVSVYMPQQFEKGHIRPNDLIEKLNIFINLAQD